MVSNNVGGAYLGQFSGITAQTVDQLVQAESAPMVLMQRQVQRIQAQGTAWGDVRSRLNNLLNKLNTLQKSETYDSKIATTSNASVVTISGDNTAISGNHDIIVNQLATFSKFTGQRVNIVKSSKDELGLTGKLTLALQYNGAFDENNPAVLVPGASTEGSVAQNKLELDISATDSLSSLVNKINNQSKQTNLTAAVVDNHLVIKSTQAGNYTIVNQGDELAIKLGLTQGQSVTGQAASFTIDGLKTVRNTNTITDVLDGATLTLIGKSPIDSTNDKERQPTTVELINDDTKFQTAVNDFVGQYNSLMGLITSDLSVGDPSKTNNQTGVLAGDHDLIQLQSQLQRLVTTSISANTATSTSTKTLSANRVGISFVDKQGTLGFDTTTFQKALQSDRQAVKDFFYQADIAPLTGTASNERGYVTTLSKFANSYLVNATGNKGIIATKTATFDSSIKDINGQIDKFQDRLSAKRQQYISQFTALDTFMMRAQAQMNYFTQQIGGNNGNNKQ